MFVLKKIMTAFLLPPASLLLVALLGLWLMLRNRGRQRLIGTVLVVGSLVGLLVLAMPVAGNRMLASLENMPPISAEQLAKAEAIVVLAGGLYHAAPEYRGDTVNHYSLERVRYAAYLARSSRLPVLITGGTVSGGRPEALAMRDVMTQEFGVPVKWVETVSRDTAENAQFSAVQLKAAGISRIALVSHVWHLPRAVPLFEHEGLTVIPAPTRYTTSSAAGWMDWLPQDYRNTRNALHEYLGRLFDRMRLAQQDAAKALNNWWGG